MSNQRRHHYQGNQRGSVGGRGRGGGRKPEKRHIHCYNCQKYGQCSNDCPENQKNQESDENSQNMKKKKKKKKKR